MSLGCYAIWDDESADADNLAWLRATSRALGDAALGYYVGETDFDAVASRGRRPFSPASWQRLAELRRKYDPTSVFHDPPEARAPDRHLDDGCASIGSWQPRAGRSPT